MLACPKNVHYVIPPWFIPSYLFIPKSFSFYHISYCSVLHIKGVIINRVYNECCLVSNYYRVVCRNPLFGQDYLDYLTSKYSVPPTSVYEYEPYSYDTENYDKPQYSFNESTKENTTPNPESREYLTFVQSISPDITKLKMELKKSRYGAIHKSITVE